MAKAPVKTVKTSKKGAKPAAPKGDFEASKKAAYGKATGKKN